VAAVFAAGLFVLAEARAASPLIRLAMFRDPMLSASLAMSALVSTVMMATLVVGPFYLSRALGLDAAMVGLVLSVGPLAAALTGVPAGRIADRFGAQRMTIGRALAIAAGSFALSMLPTTFGIAGYIAPIVVITVGYALFQIGQQHLRHGGYSPGPARCGFRHAQPVAQSGAHHRRLRHGRGVRIRIGDDRHHNGAPEAVATGMRITFAVARWPDRPRARHRGIGASAGGLAAFEAFFSGMPATTDPGMAFVLVQHLAPDHKSILADLIRRYTRMQVFEVEDGMPVLANCAYIIPPNRHMAFLNGRLELLEPSEPRGRRLPIDFFFRSLAQDQRERAIGIVLSGTGSDGTQGVRAIKGEGGMVMAQSPDSTEFDGMPRSAIATGLVDWELPPAEMAAQLIAYTAHAFGRLTSLAANPTPKVESALKKIFIVLRAQTGHDFSQYKPSAIHRRILRRMSIHQIEALDGYVKYLQQTPPEADALFRDLLIGVTNFFRDPEAFAALEEADHPAAFCRQTRGGVIRVWTTGCSTGEEAYSLAILLQEHMEARQQRFTLQLFATDIDSRAIASARAGLFPAGIASDVSPQRLARFFTAEPDGSAYRIHKGIRDLLIFSEHDLIKDPPFSRLDLICCRNLLIYLGADLQKQVAAIFHYALRPGGILFLGTSESLAAVLICLPWWTARRSSISAKTIWLACRAWLRAAIGHR
jgi:chemotaxis methyl-accepting protein methylase